MTNEQILFFAVGFVCGAAAITGLVVGLIIWDTRRMNKERKNLYGNKDF